MNIIQQPDSLCFSGNVEDFILTGITGNVHFKLQVDNTIVIDEIYTPEAGRVRIKCRDVIDELLSVVIPTSDVDFFVQSNAVKVFRATLGNMVVNFTVVKGGIGDLEETSAVFLKTQWLTLQPQQKEILLNQPEWLSYFGVVVGKVRVKAYLPDGTEEKSILDIEAGKLYAIDVSYLKMRARFGQALGYYDVWVEDTDGNRLTYIQRFVLGTPENSNIYLFENTLGGIDTVIFSGEFVEKIRTEGKIATILDESRDCDIDFEISCEQNTGFIPSRDYARWLLGFFVSKQKYHVSDAIRRIYTRESENEYTVNSLNDYSFEFFYSRQTRYNYVIRNNENLPELIEFPEVDYEIPFLVPRLSEFPIAVTADDLMLPAQYAYESKWRRISVASILGKAVGDAIGNIDLSKYWSKSEIEVVERYLTVLGEKIKAAFADDSELWAGHQFDDYLNQFLLTTSDVEFKSVLTKILTTNEITTPDFVSGLLGSGARLKDNHLELDEITVRKRMNVFQLVIQKVMHQGGILILSPGGTEITSVVDGGTYYKCTFDTKNGKLKQPFVVDDQLLCQSFDEGNTRRYWRRITSVGEDYFNLSKTDCEENSAIPTVGDEVVVLGNRTDVSRQNALILQAVGDDAPYMDTYDDINSFSLDGKLCTREGNLSGIVDEVFGQLGGTGLYAKRVYLRGKFALDTGDEIGEKLDNLEDNLVTVSGRQDTQEGNITEIRTKVEALPGQITQEVSGVIDWTKKEINTAIAETITSIVEEYYLSNSATSLIGGSWVSTSPAWVDGKFTWKRSLITYADNTITTTSPVCVTGATGATGPKGDTGPTGSQGIPGTSQYFHVKYSANSNGNPMVDTPNTYIGTSVTSSATAPTTYTAYKWVQLKGAQGAKGDQGIKGAPGANGVSSYLHIKYSDNGTTFTANGGETPGAYIGQYVDSIPTDSTTFSAYTWTKVKGDKGDKGDKGATGATGPKGETGPTGSQGIPGTSQYFHVKYSANSNGNPMTDIPNTYIGTSVTSSATAPTTYTSYKWVQLKGAQGAKGDQGIKGAPGANGVSSYLHIKYSDNGTTFTANGGETPGAYIGQYVDTMVADSTTFSKYTWTKVKGDAGAKGDKGATGATGAAGKGVKSTVVTYQASTSGTIVPPGQWGSSIPSVAANSYLWTRTIITYTDNATSTSYAIGKMGATGATGATGKGVKSTAVTYQSSTSGTMIPAGTWGSTIPSVAANSYLWTRTIITYTDNTTSTSYSIGKMGATGATGSKGDTGAQGIPGESLHGKMLNRDPEFRKGNNGVSMYNNTSGGNVTVTRIARPSDCPTTSGYCLKIKTAGAASPGCGGFVLSIQSRANAVFIQKIIAKIPVGYTITNASNSMGTGYTDTWLTSRAGTGKYETYLRKVVCGATGSFSSGGHVYLSGSPTPTASAPLEWYLAYCTVFDQTQDEGIDNLLAIAKSELVTGINQNTLGITLYAKQTDFNALGTRVSTTEATIKTQASNIELKVSKNGVVAAINASPETVKISAAKIDLVGKVTFSMLDTNAQSTVNGKITSVQATTIATTQVNTLKNSLGSLAYLSKVEQAQLGTTVIQGGHIKTDLIDVDSIFARNIVFSGSLTSNDYNTTVSGSGTSAVVTTVGSRYSKSGFVVSSGGGTGILPPSSGVTQVAKIEAIGNQALIVGLEIVVKDTYSSAYLHEQNALIVEARTVYSSPQTRPRSIYSRAGDVIIENGNVRIVNGGFGGMVRSFSLSGASATIDSNFLTGSINSATSGMVVKIKPGFEGQRLALLNYSGVSFSIYRNDRNSLSTKIPSESSALLYYTDKTWLPVQVGNLYYT